MSVAFNNPQTAGNLNVVVVGWGDTTSSITSVSDTNNGGSSNGTATLVQKASNAACSSSSASCSMTVAATGAAHLLVVSAAWPGAFSISSVSGGGTWVCPAAAVGADNGSLGSAMCYVLSSTAGATTITVNSSAVPGGGWVVDFREYSPTATVSFDTAGNVADSTNCTSCSGVPLTLTGTNDLIVQLVNPTGTVTAVSSGWGNTDFPGPNYVGSADKIGTSSGAAPTWTTSSGHATGAALAFQLGTTGGGSGYTLAAGPNTGTGLSQAIYYLPNIKAGLNTVTVTFNQPAAYVDIRVLEYSGVSTTTPFDVAAFGSGTINGGTTVATANATTSAANELIVGAGITSWTFDAAGSGFTQDTITSDGSIAEHEAVTVAGSYNASAHAYGPSGTNWLTQMATFKAATTTGTSVYADVAYAPYGEAYAQSGASDLSFTGQNNDTVSNLYDFLFREYHPVQGRWISPDPAGVGAADPMNPESWNRYAYVGNQPCDSIDPLGMSDCNFNVAVTSQNLTTPQEWNNAWSEFNRILGLANLGATLTGSSDADFTINLKENAVGWPELYPWNWFSAQPITTVGENNGIFSPTNSGTVWVNNTEIQAQGMDMGTAVGRVMAHEFGHWGIGVIHLYPNAGPVEVGIMTQGLDNLITGVATLTPNQISTLRSTCQQKHPGKPRHTGGGAKGPTQFVNPFPDPFQSPLWSIWMQGPPPQLE